MIGAPSISADVVADSVEDFSGTQGQNGWLYGYWDESADADGEYDQASDFKRFRHFGRDAINRLSTHPEFSTGELWYLEDGRYYTSLWAEGGHPHGTLDLGRYDKADQWVIRRWVSTVSGRIDIRGHAGKTMPWGKNWGGSVKFLVVAGGDRVYEAEADDGGQEYSVSVAVEVGTPVDFLIGPGSAIGVSRFTATISESGGASN
ncbi:MAG: hypothetical protein AAGD38_00190 [Acidobacteriota bacterium]